MEVFLKQDDMPQNCTGRYGYCIFAIENPQNCADYCLISDEELDVTICDDGRPAKCPLKMIPNKLHGEKQNEKVDN